MPQVEGAPSGLNSLLEEVYSKALKQYNGDKGKASATAWVAAKSAGWHKDKEGKWNKGESKEMLNKFSPILNLEFKEEAGEFYTEGFIATTHPDKSSDILSKNVIKKIVDTINNRVALGKQAAGAVSLHHDWLKEKDINMPVVGIAERAEVRELPGGHSGAWVKTHHLKTHPEFEKIKYDAEHGALAGYSIEYDATKTKNIVLSDSKEYRLIDDLEIGGYGLAGVRSILNPNAAITGFDYKEINESSRDDRDEDDKYAKCPDCGDTVLKSQMDEHMRDKHGKNMHPKAMQKEVNKMTDLNTPESTKETRLDYKEIGEMFSSLLKKELDPIRDKIYAEKAPMLETGKDEIATPNLEVKEISEYKESIKSNNVHLQMKTASNLINKFPEIYDRGAPLQAIPKHFKTYGPRDNFIAYEGKEFPSEMKAGLSLTSNAEATYYQGAAELNDVYDPVIYNHLNDMTRAWGLLTKEDYSNRAIIQFRAKTARLASAAGGPIGGYSEGTGTWTAGNVTRVKFQQAFCNYRAIVQVTGQMIADAQGQGGVGDILSIEMADGARDLAKRINTDLLTGSSGSNYDGTLDSKLLGFQHLCLNTGNLYTKARGTYTTLQGGYESVSVAITLAQLRKMIRTNVINGADKNDLVFITAYIQKDFILNILQAAQRLIPTSSRAGFEGIPEFDGVPIFADPDCGTTDLFLIDLRTTRVAMKLAPTVTEFGITDDSRKFFIKTYFNIYSTNPNWNYWVTGLSTT